jgi:hypothetical protein
MFSTSKIDVRATIASVKNLIIKFISGIAIVTLLVNNSSLCVDSKRCQKINRGIESVII